MPIPLGVLAVAGAGAGPVVAGNAYEWLETQVLTSDQASVTFSNLNSTYGSTYQHLQIRMAVFSDTWITMRMNGVTTGQYARHELRGNGSTVISTGASNQNTMLIGLGSSATVPVATITDILDAFETTKNKTIRSLSGVATTTSYIQLTSGVWLDTAAITSVEIKHFDSTFKTGSRFSLYGMRSS